MEVNLQRQPQVALALNNSLPCSPEAFERLHATVGAGSDTE